MSYTVTRNGEPTPIRFITYDDGGYVVLQPFIPKEWECDACAPPSKRYRVVFQSGIESYYTWYEVVLDDDDFRCVITKVMVMQEIHRITDQIRQLRMELRRYTGE